MEVWQQISRNRADIPLSNNMVVLYELDVILRIDKKVYPLPMKLYTTIVYILGYVTKKNNDLSNSWRSYANKIL